MKTSRYIGYFGIMFFIFSCNDSPTEPSPSITIPDIDEVCVNLYSDIDGSFLSCDDDCSLYSGDCYHDYDIQLLESIRENNEYLNETILLDIGSQVWTDGRLTELNISNLELTYIPENLCNLDCQINVSNNQLCQEYQFDCINTWGTQSGLESMDECGICYGTNQDKDECDVCFGDNSTCTDECGVVNGNNLDKDCSGTCFGNNFYQDEICGDCSVNLWGQCYNIETTTILYLDGDQLTGEIPISIGNLTNLEELHLFNNQLTGEIPVEIGNLTNLESLSLRDTQLTGEIPVEIGNLTNLDRLYLYNNQLSGEIPSSIGNLLNLDYLYLYNNQLSGEIPSNICELNLNHFYPFSFDISWNQLCPPYPSCISGYNIESQDTSDCP